MVTKYKSENGELYDTLVEAEAADATFNQTLSDYADQEVRRLTAKRIIETENCLAAVAFVRERSGGKYEYVNVVVENVIMIKEEDRV